MVALLSLPLKFDDIIGSQDGVMQNGRQSIVLNNNIQLHR